MEIRKLECMNKHTSIKCTAKLRKANVKSTRSGSAVVALETMHNTTIISNIASDHGAYFADIVTDEDVKSVLQ